MKQLFQKLLHPSRLLLAFVYPITVLVVAGAICAVIFVPTGSPLDILVYILYALSALFFGYSIYTLVLVIPKARVATIAFLERHALTHSLLHDYGFRTLTFAFVSFLISVLYSGFNAYLGIAHGSIWYGALATYYILLALMRGGLLVGIRRTQGSTLENDPYAKEILETKNYRLNGFLLLLIHLSLSAAIAQMIFSDRAFYWEGWVIYAVAAYTFYKITVAIIHFIKTRKNHSLMTKATRNIDLADALVSILALQTALLHTFSTGEVDISLFNTLTGSVVSLFSLGLGIVMIWQSTRRLNTLKTEHSHGQ